jgi:hypothetical protein
MEASVIWLGINMNRVDSVMLLGRNMAELPQYCGREAIKQSYLSDMADHLVPTRATASWKSYSQGWIYSRKGWHRMSRSYHLVLELVINILAHTGKISQR